MSCSAKRLERHYKVGFFFCFFLFFFSNTKVCPHKHAYRLNFFQPALGIEAMLASLYLVSICRWRRIKIDRRNTIPLGGALAG
jgi:hypothetical protein